jgi:dTDP-4-amino-4,6-dideoxygalactose transaminase
MNEKKSTTPSAADNPLYVTRPYLPPLEEFLPYLDEIWKTRVLTNGGPFHARLEEELAEFLSVPYISLFTNGTIALITALQSLRITGEVITTPYSFVATAHALLWQGAKPVFVDIDKDTLNLDHRKIEAAITKQTTAILPVHCYGNVCNVKAIQEIADVYNLRVVYDACHSFGVKDDGGSVLRFGDLSVLSFHATKVFNTFEGGAIISPDRAMKKRIDHLKNFGFEDELSVIGSGINGKMSELNAAVGLVQLKHYAEQREKRRAVDARYRAAVQNIPGLRCIDEQPGLYRNYAYFPILVGPEYPISRDDLYARMKENNINPRRYFYPLISDFSMYSGLPCSRVENLPVAHAIANSVLCLPMFSELSQSDQDRVIDILNR